MAVFLKELASITYNDNIIKEKNIRCGGQNVHKALFDCFTSIFCY
jgi:hypothetical protein